MVIKNTVESSTFGNPEFRCNCHFKHAEKIDHIEKAIDTHISNHKDQDKCVRDALEKKLPNKLFYTLISILVIVMGGVLTFQWANYEKLNKFETSVTKDIAVLQTQLESHMLQRSYPSISNEP